VTEQYDVPLSQTGKPPISTRIRNAAVEGYHNLIGTNVGLVSWFLAYGPVLLLIAGLLFFPTRLIRRKTRSRA
jgi:hypothetical protein